MTVAQIIVVIVASAAAFVGIMLSIYVKKHNKDFEEFKVEDDVLYFSKGLGVFRKTKSAKREEVKSNKRNNYGVAYIIRYNGLKPIKCTFSSSMYYQQDKMVNTYEDMVATVDMVMRYLRQHKFICRRIDSWFYRDKMRILI